MLKLISCFVILLLASCSNNKKPDIHSIDVTTVNGSTAKVETISFFFDSIYQNKYYKIDLNVFDTTEYAETNCIFTFSQKRDGKYITLFSDSVLSENKEVRVEDFNNDKIPDILIQSSSDVRSNQAYNLYLVDTIRNTLKKIKGFNEVKNPEYIPAHDLIETTAMSGRNWTSLSKIKGDSVIMYPFVVYDDQKDNNNYDRDYARMLKKVLSIEKRFK